MSVTYTISDNGCIGVRSVNEQGIVHRHVLNPGDPLDNEDASVVAAAKASWTPELIASYSAEKKAIQNKQDAEMAAAIAKADALKKAILAEIDAIKDVDGIKAYLKKQVS
jgi:hypothetical protein